MNEILIFLLGLFLAAFCVGGIGFLCYLNEHTKRLTAEAEYTKLSADIDRLEELQKQAEAGNAHLTHQLQHAGAIIQHLRAQLTKCGGGLGFQLLSFGGQPPAAMQPDGSTDEDSEQPPAPSGLN